jgi:hypothetical protein
MRSSIQYCTILTCLTSFIYSVEVWCVKRARLTTCSIEEWCFCGAVNWVGWCWGGGADCVGDACWVGSVWFCDVGDIGRGSYVGNGYTIVFTAIVNCSINTSLTCPNFWN